MTDNSILILGRQPALGLAELESLYGADKVSSIGSQAALVQVDPCRLAFDRLGGSTKFCRLLTTLDTIDWKQIERFLLQVSPGHSQRMPDGKMTLGLSLVGLDVPLKQLEATGLKLKKAIRATGRPVRLVPNKEAELNAAQIIHNKLTSPNGWELVFIRDGAKTTIAQTVKVQDIASYTQRDRGRPKRDARVGMLPPKLAQIIINLAVGKLPEDKLDSICEIPAGQPIPPKLLDGTILDPFCGTGVVLQEALLMGYNVYGTDLEARMVDYTKANLAWLEPAYGLKSITYNLEKADATTHQWSSPINFVAGETYLGRPFTTRPDDAILNQTISECNLIIKKFLRNIHGQLQPNARLCLAVPAWSRSRSSSDSLKANQASRPSGREPLEGSLQDWQVKPDQFKHLPLVDSLEDIGYNRVSFERVREADLLYYRADQIVARQLLVLNRK